MQGEVLTAGERRTRRGGTLQTVSLGDDTGVVFCIWFNQRYVLKQFRPGRRVLASGLVQSHGGQRQLAHPDFEILDEQDGDQAAGLHTGRLVPVYPLTSGVGQHWLRGLVHQALERLGAALPETLPAVPAGPAPAAGPGRRPGPGALPRLGGRAGRRPPPPGLRGDLHHPGADGVAPRIAPPSGGRPPGEARRPDPPAGGRPALRPDRRPAPGAGGDPGGSALGLGHAPAAAGGRGLGQDPGGPDRGALRHRAGLAGHAHGTDGGAGPTARTHPAAAGRAPGGDGRDPHRFDARRRSGAPCWPGWGPGRSTCWWAPTP